MPPRKNHSLSLSSSCSGISRDSLNEKCRASLSLPSPSMPSLPSPVTKTSPPRHNIRSRIAIVSRLLAATSVLLIFWHFLGTYSSPPDYQVFRHLTAQPHDHLLGTDTLPAEPTVLIVGDDAARSRWTVSIPANVSFPLRSHHYNDICSQSEALKDTILRESSNFRVKDWRIRNRYYSKDHTFLEPDEAETIGALPRAAHSQTDGVCERSLTFAFDTDSASFGESLLLLWMSYGLAKKEGRAFFIDDARWPYGRYSSYFTPPPAPSCARPPPQHVVPCPHDANHLIVSAATVPWTFGSAFRQELLSHQKLGAKRSQKIFDLLRVGYEDLFHLLAEDASYASSQIAKFRHDVQHQSNVVGMHIRRGNCHPFEYQFNHDYLPLDRYASVALELQARIARTKNATKALSTADSDSPSTFLLASDDPEIFSYPELSQAAHPHSIAKAQDRIQLATKAALDLASPPPDGRQPDSPYVKHTDENSGWDGGFYSALFFSLGRTTLSSPSPAQPDTHHDPQEVDQDDLPEQALRLRELVGRSYLLDLAVLGEGGADGIVCAVSSATCRVLGVMLGWDAMTERRWVNIDDGRAWSWNGQL